MSAIALPAPKTWRGGLVLVGATIMAMAYATRFVTALIVSSSPDVEQGAEFCPDTSFIAFDGEHFPDETCTGYEPTGVTLTAYGGPTTITTPTTIDSKEITSQLTVGSGGSLTITRSWLHPTNTTIIYVDDAARYSDSGNGANFLVTITDSTMSCGDANNSATGLWESYIKVVRVHMTHCENFFSVNQKVWIEDSYLHDMSSSGGEAHEDTVQLSNGHWTGSAYGPPFASLNFTVKRSTLFGLDAGDISPGTSAIISNSAAPDTNALIDGNYLDGGANTLYCSPNTEATNYVVTNNAFGDRHWESGDSTTLCGTITTFSGNTCYVTGEAMTTSTTCGVGIP